jgi:thiosulfate/3-mercaptopyruvate sulfurtransferase
MKRYTLALSVLFLLLGRSAFAVELPGPLVDTAWLAKHHKQVVVLDVRADVKSFTEAPVYATDKKTGKKVLAKVSGHIPGSVLVDYKNVRTKRKVGNLEVDYLIPEKSIFEKLMQDAGVNRDSTVVIATKGVNNLDMTMATRVYWQLKYFGDDKIAILNGGLNEWIKDGHEVSTAPSSAKPGNWVATAEHKELLASSDDVAKAVKDKQVQLVDNRPLSQYLGVAKQPYVYEYGHIPGAKPYPNELFVAAGGPAKFLPTPQLKDLAKQMGVKTDAKTITYCNSGHLASGGWFMMHELMGNKNVKLYDGSMHEWTLEKHPVTAMKME